MKNFVVILIASALVGFISSEVAFRRNMGRLHLIEDRLGAIDRNLASLGEQRAKLETSIDLLLKRDELPSRVPEQNARLRSGFVDQAEFAKLQANTEEVLKTVREALDLHGEQIEQLQEDVLATVADVELQAAQIAGLQKP